MYNLYAYKIYAYIKYITQKYIKIISYQHYY